MAEYDFAVATQLASTVVATEVTEGKRAAYVRVDAVDVHERA
jgi:hypothetical protein